MSELQEWSKTLREKYETLTTEQKKEGILVAWVPTRLAEDLLDSCGMPLILDDEETRFGESYTAVNVDPKQVTIELEETNFDTLLASCDYDNEKFDEEINKIAANLEPTNNPSYGQGKFWNRYNEWKRASEE